jgi:hypothetical protein
MFFHEDVWRSEGIAPLDRGEWSASQPGRFTPKERAARSHSIGRWVDPRAFQHVAISTEVPQAFMNADLL